MEPPQADPSQWWQLAASLVFILALIELFLLASYEATFILLSRSSLERLAEGGTPRAQAMLRIYEPRHRLRLMARLGEALGVISCALSLLYLVRPLYASYGLPGYYGLITSFLGTLLTAFLVLSTPRRLRFDEEGEEVRIAPLAMAFVPLHILLAPLTHLLDKLTSGDYTDEDFRAEKEEELRSIVESEGESGVIEESEREMIQGVFGFHDRIVREVMVPRVDMIALEQSSTLQDLIRQIEDKGHSRLPIYDESLDKIRGVAYAKDLLQLLLADQGTVDMHRPIRDFIDQPEGSPFDFIHPAYYVPETKKIDILLNDMRNNRMRMAIVLDEYSGTAGMVTTEDLIEEIVGDIQDEYDDEEEQLFNWLVPGESLLSNARIDIEDLNELLNINLPTDSGFETLGGYIFDHLGQIPSEGQTFQADSLEVTILKVDGQRIGQVRLTRIETHAAEEESS